METSDWIALVALAASITSVAIQVKRIRWEDKRLRATERRLAAQEARQYLSELRESLRHLKSAAAAHLDEPAGDPATLRALQDLYDQCEFLAGRAPWHDVRTAALRAVYECGRATGLIEREAPDADPGLRREIGWAMDEATRTIAARLDELPATFDAVEEPG